MDSIGKTVDNKVRFMCNILAICKVLTKECGNKGKPPLSPPHSKTRGGEIVSHFPDN